MTFVDNQKPTSHIPKSTNTNCFGMPRYIIWTRDVSDHQDDLQYLGKNISSVLFLPTVRKQENTTKKTLFFSKLQTSLEQTDFYHSIIITSPFAAKIFTENINAWLHYSHKLQCICFGSTTTRILTDAKLPIAQANYNESHAPTANSADLAKKWAYTLSCNPQHKKKHSVWYLRAQHTAHPIADVFKKQNIILKEHCVYTTLTVNISELCSKTLSLANSLLTSQIISVFASPSAFAAAQKISLPIGDIQVVIGKTTEKQLKKSGLRPHVIEHPPSIQALAKAAISYL